MCTGLQFTIRGLSCAFNVPAGGQLSAAVCARVSAVELWWKVCLQARIDSCSVRVSHLPPSVAPTLIIAHFTKYAL